MSRPSGLGLLLQLCGKGGEGKEGEGEGQVKGEEGPAGILPVAHIVNDYGHEGVAREMFFLRLLATGCDRWRLVGQGSLFVERSRQRPILLVQRLVLGLPAQCGQREFPAACQDRAP